MMQTALRRWHLLESSGGSTSAASNGATNGRAPHEAVPDYVPARPSRYPHDGLVLRLAVRDLPREIDTRKDDWRKSAWNLDYAWFTRDEARAIVPQPRTAGSRCHVPEEIVRRLARFHLRDFVRGEPSAWADDAIRHGELISEIVSRDGNEVRLRLEGRVTLQHEVRWTRPEDGESRAYDCGFDAVLSGDAIWDDMASRFVAFDLLAAGPRWGTNQYNNRNDDLGPAPMGVAFTLAGAEPRDRTPPHQIWHRDYFGA
jgi:hypothetical protein